MKLVPDTSVIIDGRITARIESGEFEGATIIVPEAVASELEAQANQGKETGFSGLEELKKLNSMAKGKRIKLLYEGERPTLDQIKLAAGGEIDALIRKVAIEQEAVFVTSDIVQAEVAKAKGLEVIYMHPNKAEHKEELKIMEFFTKDTMSVHLKDRVSPMAKRGTIGKMKYVRIREALCTEKELKEIAHKIVESAKKNPDGFIEIERKGATVIQLGDLRVAIARPPFSDGIEITAVRPIADVKMDDYKLSGKLKERITERQRGILIAGPPGAGKSTFAAAVACYITERGYVVKTMESPRDLKVPDEITQYTALEGSMVNTSDILLLVRPDYTIFDEMRRTRDFEVFADMRLAGVGMVGVVHSARAIDSLQRLIGRLDLGMIPQVVDTIIFVDKGIIEKVYTLRFSVKIPHGMVEADLARPVIEVIDFESGDAEYEVYTYGEQIVIMSVERRKKSWKTTEEKLRKEMEKHAEDFQIEMLSDSKAVVHASKGDIAYILGKGGKNISKIESKVGISIDVRAKEGEEETAEFSPEIEEMDKHVILKMEDLIGKKVEVSIDNEFLFNATVGRRGDVRITKDSPAAERVLEAFKKGEKIVVKSAD
jgi:ATPase